MRKELSKILLKKSEQKDFIFLSGDLGFMALEELEKSMGKRFINAGIAEQNMISVAAGLAQSKLRPWVYSIAPFVFARPYEQIRNDICLHSLPVVLVGNGGGYGYGIMGATHHAIDDYGALLNLNCMQIFIPAFVEDISFMIEELFHTKNPSYLRLGADTKPKTFVPPKYAPWRKLFSGKKTTIVFVGPIVGEFLKYEPENLNCSVWVLSQYSQHENRIPDELLDDIKETEKFILVEEHLKHGSIGSMLIYELCKKQIPIKNFTHLHAQGYPSGTYGSQSFHRKESGLDAESILKLIPKE